jgi:MFS family permease
MKMIANTLFRTNQGTAFSALTLAYRVGQMVGLPIGGFLAHPERHFPSVFNTAFWLYYPFLLPCLAGAGFALLGATLGLIFLKEVSSCLIPSLFCPSINSPARRLHSE